MSHNIYHFRENTANLGHFRPKPLHFLGFYAILYGMITSTKKAKIIKAVQLHDTDTGSPEAQISILTKRIEELAGHLKKHAKDRHSRRGLLQMVADRQNHMKYLQKKDTKRYNSLMKKLDLKQTKKA